jgi:hypothetical protein
MNVQEEIVELAKEIGELNSKQSDQWLEVQKHLRSNINRDDAISVLIAHFRLKDKVEGVEHRLRTLLHTHYADK